MLLFGAILIGYWLVSIPVAAQQGCCSHHDGISYCGSSGYYICVDGTRSPSCTCGYSTPVQIPNIAPSYSSSSSAPAVIYSSTSSAYSWSPPAYKIQIVPASEASKESTQDNGLINFLAIAGLTVFAGLAYLFRKPSESSKHVDQSHISPLREMDLNRIKDDFEKRRSKEEQIKSSSILLVEDEASARILVTQVLENAGYKVETAVDGFDALLQMFNSVYALVMLDIVMPKLDGIETLRFVKENPELMGAQRIVMWSNIGGQAAVNMTRELGALDYWLPTETRPEELPRMVRRYFMPQRNSKSSL